jgi:hypothetical protein
MMIPRRSFLFGLVLVLVMVVFVFGSVDAKPKKRRRYERVSGPPTLSLASDSTTVRACDNARVQLIATASSPEGRPLRYKWTTNGGKLSGQGANTTWDLAGAQPGVYQAVVEVDDGRDRDCVAFSSASIVITDCPPPPPPPPVCPNVSISCPDSITENAPVTFTATINGGSGSVRPSYNWNVSAGRIISGQGTPSITVETGGLAGQTIRASLDVGGYGMPCPASCAVSVPIVVKPHKFDEYYDIARNDEKARLDNYAIQLQSEPGTQGYIIVYPSRRARANEAQARAKRISDYLVNSRGIDPSRFTVTMGPQREDWLFELWIVPQGAPPPVPSR